MEDSTNEKVKHEKQRRNIMYMLFGQYVYISICQGSPQDFFNG